MDPTEIQFNAAKVMTNECTIVTNEHPGILQIKGTLTMCKSSYPQTLYVASFFHKPLNYGSNQLFHTFTRHIIK